MGTGVLLASWHDPPEYLYHHDGAKNPAMRGVHAKYRWEGYPDQQKVLRELVEGSVPVAVRDYRRRGLTEIETKEQRNQRGIPGSPDRAESLIMAFMKVVPQETIINLAPSGGYQISPI